MKHFSFAFILAVLSLNACQNPDNAAKPALNGANQPEMARIPHVDVPHLEKSILDAQATVDEMERTVKSLYDLPADIKKKNPAGVESMRNNLAGMLEKQQHILAEAKEALKDLRARESFQATDSVRVKIYTDQLEQSGATVQQMKEEIKKLTEGQ